MSKDEFFRRAADREECLQDWEEGEAIRLGPAHSRHFHFIHHLYAPLEAWLEKTATGCVDGETFVDLGKVWGVDLAVLFVGHEDRHVEGRIVGVPDIIVEVLSDDSVERDRITKFKAYHAAGVPWYWIGDPVAGTLEEYHHTAEGYVRTAEGSLDLPFATCALAGFSISLGGLMQT